MVSEPYTDLGEGGATGAEESQPSATPSKALSVEDIINRLMPLIDQRMSEHVGALGANVYRGVQGLLDSKISEIREQFGVDRETALAMRELAASSLGEEAMAGFSERVNRERMEQELAGLKADQEKANRPINAREAERARMDAAWPGHEAELMAYCEEIDVDYKEATKLMAGKTVWDYENRYIGWKRDHRKAADSLADRNRKVAEGARVALDTTRGGAGKMSNQATWAAYGRGEIPWSSTVQAAGHALNAL